MIDTPALDAGREPRPRSRFRPRWFPERPWQNGDDWERPGPTPEQLRRDVIGTAVVLFPVLRRYSETAALGYVAARIMECALIAVGILSVLAVLSLRQTAGGDADGYLPVAQALVSIHDWTFLLGPGFVVGIGNGLLLGFLMYRSHLVPRPMALFGLIGGPLMSLSGLAVLFGAYEQSSVPSALATLPEIIWEASLGIYLTAVGFRRVRAGTGPGQMGASRALGHSAEAR